MVVPGVKALSMGVQVIDWLTMFCIISISHRHHEEKEASVSIIYASKSRDNTCVYPAILTC